MKPDDYLELALELLQNTKPGRPKQVRFRRAVSNAYYAMFHAVCIVCSDALVGASSNRPERAWLQLYRSFQHNTARDKCQNLPKTFPDPLHAFAAGFIVLHGLRAHADYDPSLRLSLSESEKIVERARADIARLEELDARDRKAFAVWTLHSQRGSTLAAYEKWSEGHEAS
ncbi:MAG: hypothetical protein AAF658_13320 [Myxococcota bacterium]